MLRSNRLRPVAGRIAAEAIVTLAGAALLAGAYLASNDWLNRHFPPDFRLSYHAIERVILVLRVAVAVAGAALLFLARPALGRLIARGSGGRLAANAVLSALAVILALGVSEFVLRTVSWRATEEVRAESEPLRRQDARLGWVFRPSRTGHRLQGGRNIAYSFDAAGYRVKDAGAAVDFNRPAIIFAGESIMTGYGLTWAESVPAQTASMSGVQAANIAVNGYASDQIYLRLKQELPRFRRPVAVVVLFTPMLFRRNLDDDRPHLGPGLVWQPAVERWRLAALARRLAPYRGETEIRRGVMTTRAILHASVGLAHRRGATVVIAVPQFLPETPAERLVREQVLGGSGLPYVRVPLDPRWRVPGDWHPDARAAQAMAVAIAGFLKTHPPASAADQSLSVTNMP